MLSQQSSLRCVSQQSLLQEFRTFIAGASKTPKCYSLELTKTALSLLKQLPACREAIFEYFYVVFDNSTFNYVVRLEKEIATGQMPPASEDDENNISEIHSLLCCFISTNAEAWAPIISKWSLNLLGELSTKYAGRAHVSTGVNETLQLWMSCISTRTLIDITTQCLSCLMNSDTEACINALLDTSVKHSPNFDWVVAHVGSCFPNTVITRVLSCGLKDFCQNKSYEQGCESKKLKSVVGILGHLAASHCNDIRNALLDVFNWSLQEPLAFVDDATKAQKKAVVPFILQLANLSPKLFSTICKGIKSTLTLPVIVELFHHTRDYCCKYFGSSESLQTLVVNLILKCEVGAVDIVNLLIDCTEKVPSKDEVVVNTIREVSQEILDIVLIEIDTFVRSSTQQNPNCRILDCFVREINEINELLLSANKKKYQTGAQIITFIGHSNPHLLIHSLTNLFEKSKTDQHLALITKILFNELIDKTKEPYNEKGGHFAVILEQVLSKFSTNLNLSKNSGKTVSDSLWSKLLTLLRWEKNDPEIFLLKSRIISRALLSNLSQISRLFASDKIKGEIIHEMAQLLDELEVPATGGHEVYRVPVKATLNFTMAAVNYFFVCCAEKDDFLKYSGWRKSKSILKRLCIHSKAARVLALRELVEKTLFTNNNVFFGATNVKEVQNGDLERSVLEQNRKMSKMIPLTKHSSVFNGGIIGNGKKKTTRYETLPDVVISENTNQLLETIKACCATDSGSPSKGLDVSMDNVTLVSLLLVQFISPDVMYNGLPWPDEEFTKVTIERDLYIRRLFNNNPVLWSLLSFIATYRPTLCYCSVLLRAITATLIHQWNSMGAQSKSCAVEGHETLVENTVKVLDVMALGQLLPPPLSGIRDVVPYLNCSEVVQILRNCVWNYMKDNVPSPALFVCDSSGVYWRDPSHSKPSEIYVNTLRSIMQKNIKTVGPSYCQMFVIVVSHSE